MAVHFKFRSAVNFDSISIDGNGITIASLKEKIIEQKNLGRSTNFDLVITNAESGEEYTEDSFFLPKNTSVIIKRVPAKRGRATTLSVHDTPEDHNEVPEQPPSQSERKNSDVAQLAFTSTMDELYDMDDFGVDLYAVDESALTHVETNEMSNASGLLAKSITDGRRLASQTGQGIGRDAVGRNSAKESLFHTGLIYGRVTPPPGYVCHRCGQPGHFIQHCPTNGDPAYDMKKSFRGRSDGEDSSLFPGVLQLNSKEADPVPPELRCPLCQGIFKEAVMIPCCQYSFCDTCVREYLLEKGLCPQCRSEKPKSSDLLPNVALRQAIDRFTSAQLDATLPNEGADGESATKAAKATSPRSQPLKPSFPAKDGASMVVIGKQSDLLAVDDSVCESAIGSKQKDGCEGSKSVVHVGEAGKKNKKLYARPGSTSDGEHIGTVKPRKVNRYCFVCGSPDHIARNCPGNGGDNMGSFLPQRAMFHSVGPVPPRAMTPFGQEMFWPGQTLMPVRPLPLGYGEGMYGPCAAMPYGAPALTVAPYSVSSYPPPMYPNPQMHGYLNGAPPTNLTPRDRPLSREEFMELQDRERRRRLAQERQEREPSEEKRDSGDVGNGRESPSSDSQRSLHTQWHSGNKPPGNLWRQMKQTMSSKSRQKQGRKLQVQRSDERMSKSDDDSGYDDSRALGLHLQVKQQSVKPHPSVVRKSIHKLYEHVTSERPSPDRDDGRLSARMRVLKEEGYSRLSKQGSVGHLSFEKHEHSNYVKHDGTRVSEAGAAEMLQSHHRAKKSALEGSKVTHSDQHVKSGTDSKDRHDRIAHSKDRHDHLALLDEDEDGYEVDTSHSWRKHHGQATSPSGDDLKKKKKKRKHKKHKSEAFMEGAGGSSSLEGLIMESSSGSKKRKHSHASEKNAMRSVSSVELAPVEDDVEEGGRWQMGDGLRDEEDMDPPRVKSKRKHHRSSKSAVA